jgi:hypothetical protein
MNTNTWDRYGPISGFAMIAIGFAAVLFERAPRTAADFTVNRVALLTQSMLFLIGAAVGLWFLGSLRVHLQRFEGDPGRLSSVAFGAGVAWTTLNMAAQAFQVGVADDPTGAAPAAVLTSMNALFTIANLPLAVTLVAVAIVSFRHRAFPRWQAWLALAAAGAQTLLWLTTVIHTGPLAPSGWLSFALYPFFLIWLAPATVTMIKTAQAHPSSRTIEPPTRADAVHGASSRDGGG